MWCGVVWCKLVRFNKKTSFFCTCAFDLSYERCKGIPKATKYPVILSHTYTYAITKNDHHYVLLKWAEVVEMYSLRLALK